MASVQSLREAHRLYRSDSTGETVVALIIVLAVLWPLLNDPLRRSLAGLRD